MKITMDDNRFERGYEAHTYVNNLRNYRTLVKRLMDEAEADSSHAAALRSAAERFETPVRATMMTEDWCGDSACNTPILSNLFQKAGIEFRVFRGSEETALKEMYESEGDDHIPVVSLWDGSGKELLRWIEAPAEMQKKKEAWKAEHPEFMELYQKQNEDKEAAKQFAALYRQFIETMAEWYQADMWSETTRELVEKLEKA
ncbi:MAG: thioredoxin family protein [Spirochaetaceae bacterium]